MEKCFRRESKMDLEEIRKEIDQLDRQIAQLLTRRMECSNEVAAFKKANGLPIYHSGSGR